jgi:hypothetical protein
MSRTGSRRTLGETDFDENALLAVFDTSGSLIGSARLRRPHTRMLKAN